MSVSSCLMLISIYVDPIMSIAFISMSIHSTADHWWRNLLAFFHLVLIWFSFFEIPITKMKALCFQTSSYQYSDGWSNFEKMKKFYVFWLRFLNSKGYWKQIRMDYWKKKRGNMIQHQFITLDFALLSIGILSISDVVV